MLVSKPGREVLAIRKERQKTLFRLLYILLSIAVIAVIGLVDPNLKDTLDVLQTLNPFWLGMAIGSALLFWLTDGLLLHDITSYMYPHKIGFWQSLKVGIIGLYYGALTPFSSGGQPFQVVYMRRNGIPVGTGTCIVCMKFAVYELSMCFFYIVAMIVRGAYFYENFREVFWITTAGAAINFCAVLLISFAMINQRLVLRIGHRIIGFLAKLRILRHPEKAEASFGKTIDEYREAVVYIKQHKLRCFGSFWISVLNLVCLYSASYLVYRAMGFTKSSWLSMMTMQAFHFLAVSFFPTPGASGASEGGFYLYFQDMIPKDMIFIVMLLWRFLTYYLVLFVGCLVVIWDEFHNLGKRPKLVQNLQGKLHAKQERSREDP